MLNLYDLQIGDIVFDERKCYGFGCVVGIRIKLPNFSDVNEVYILTSQGIQVIYFYGSSSSDSNTGYLMHWTKENQRLRISELSDIVYSLEKYRLSKT